MQANIQTFNSLQINGLYLFTEVNSCKINQIYKNMDKRARIAKISILKLEGIVKKKKSYERRDYESVDKKSLS